MGSSGDNGNITRFKAQRGVKLFVVLRDDLYLSAGALSAIGFESGVEWFHGGEAVGDQLHRGVV